MGCGASFSAIAKYRYKSTQPATSKSYATHSCKMDESPKLANNIFERTKLNSWRPSNHNIFLGRLSRQHDVGIFQLQFRRVHLWFRGMCLFFRSHIGDSPSDNWEDIRCLHADAVEFEQEIYGQFGGILCNFEDQIQCLAQERKDAYMSEVDSRNACDG